MTIPVSFEFEGKHLVGDLSPTAGGGSGAMYHLTVNGFHWGKLWYSGGHPGFNGSHSVSKGWRFSSNNRQPLEAMAEDFGRVVEAAFGYKGCW